MVADDLTGAADSGVQLARAGYRTAVVFRGESPPGDLDAAVVDTDSRALPPEAARERVLEAGAVLREAGIAYKKLDSTLRGPVAAELAAALAAGGRERAIVAPAFPAGGRTTRGGVQLLRGVPVHETDLARDPRTPVRESRIPALLAAGGLERISLLKTPELADPAAVRRALSQAVWVVADAEAQEHLEALVRVVPEPEEVLWAGSAGLALALGAVYPGPGAGYTGVPRVRNALVVVGSLSDVSREQLRRLLEAPDVEPVPLDSRRASGSGQAAAVEAARRRARGALAAGKSAALYSTDDSGDPAVISGALAEVVSGLSDEEVFEGLVLTGGDTAVQVVRRLGGRGILLADEIEAGVPAGTVIGPRARPVVTKAGAFGGPDTLRRALRILTGARKE